MIDARKTVLVTGTSRGIGKAVVEVLSDRYDIVRVGRSGHVEERGDLTVRAFCDHLIERYAESVDVVVLNAGFISADIWKCAELNFLSTAYLAFEFYKRMRPGGMIVIINSTAQYMVNRPAPLDRVPYHVSKAALAQLTAALHNTMQRQVRVVEINPSSVNTAFGRSDGRVPVENTAEYELRSFDIVPMPPEHVAGMVRWAIEQPEWAFIGKLDVKNTFTPGAPGFWSYYRSMEANLSPLPSQSEPKTEFDDPYIGLDLKYPSTPAAARQFVWRSPLRFDHEKLLVATVEALQAFPFDERNQICLTSVAGSPDRLYGGVGRLHDAGRTVLESDYSVFNEEFAGTYLEEVYRRVVAASPYGIGRVRLMRMRPRNCYSVHQDADLRFHLAIQTSPGCFLLATDRKPEHIPANGYLYVADTRLPHTALNTTMVDRVHLVFSTYERPAAA